MRLHREKRVRIGAVGVDAGLLMLVDPCYVREGYDWGTFCAEYFNGKETTTAAQMHGGVVFESGFGDGTYDVYATLGDYGDWGWRVKKVEVILISDTEDDDEEDDEEDEDDDEA